MAKVVGNAGHRSSHYGRVIQLKVEPEHLGNEAYSGVGGRGPESYHLMVRREHEKRSAPLKLQERECKAVGIAWLGEKRTRREVYTVAMKRVWPNV